MKVSQYGICDCGKWCDAPGSFDETKHFMKCECGSLMYLQRHNPREAGYRELSKTSNVTLVEHKG